MIIKTTFDHEGKRIYIDTRDHREYRRIVGGLAWPYVPEMRPGAYVILGEERHKDEKWGVRPVRILREHQNTPESIVDVKRLLGSVLSSREAFQCWTWVGQRFSPYEDFLADLDQDLYRQKRPRLNPAPAMLLDEVQDERIMERYVQLIKARTTGQKTFFFGAGSQAAGMVAEIGPDYFNRKVWEFPLLAALLFSLAEIDLNPMRDLQVHRRNDGPADSSGY